MDESPYHEGEQTLQARLGMRDKMEKIGRRVVHDVLPDEHREFYARLPWLLVGSLDETLRPWASVVTGEPGFVTSPDPRTLTISAKPVEGDVLPGHLLSGAPLGLLGLELHTRRRNRANGRLASLVDGRWQLRIDQAFGNCPKYINRRDFVGRRTPTPPGAPVVTDRLDDRQRRIVESADTLFIASSYLPEDAPRGKHGVDVSHRGGRPGFVRIDSDGTFVIPDYVGNFAFNTLGNIDKDRRAGLLFIDFDSGDLLQATGEAWIDWNAPELRTATGVQRLVRVRPAELRLLPCSFPFEAPVRDFSPNLEAIDSLDGV